MAQRSRLNKPNRRLVQALLSKVGLVVPTRRLPQHLTNKPPPSVPTHQPRGREDTPPYGRVWLDSRATPGALVRMDLPRRKRLPHEVPPWVPEGSFFFITIDCRPPGRNHLCWAGVGDAVLAAAAYYHTHLKWHCRLMLLMPDHVHAVIAFPAMPGMQTTVRFWKRFLSRVHKVQWQRDFFDHRLRDHHQQMAKIEYVLKNPVRRGLCERVEEWPWIYRPADRLPPRLGD